MTENSDNDLVSITFLPDDVTILVPKGSAILEAALEHDIKLDHNCSGFCACSSCHVIIREGMDKVSDMTDEEEEQLDEAEGLTLHSRLGCQTRVYGNIIVEIPQ
ncbi:2Fe-2S iron-sulfur cluster-binding protein [candidate division KSB1 bacterium]